MDNYEDPALSQQFPGLTNRKQAFLQQVVDGHVALIRFVCDQVQRKSEEYLQEAEKDNETKQWSRLSFDMTEYAIKVLEWLESEGKSLIEQKVDGYIPSLLEAMRRGAQATASVRWTTKNCKKSMDPESEKVGRGRKRKAKETSSTSPSQQLEILKAIRDRAKAKFARLEQAGST